MFFSKMSMYSLPQCDCRVLHNKHEAQKAGGLLCFVLVLQHLPYFVVRKGKLRKSYNNPPRTTVTLPPRKNNAAQAALCLRPRASARTNYESTHTANPQAALPLRPRPMSPIRGVHRPAPAQMGARNNLRFREKQKKGQTSRPIHNTRQRPQHRLAKPPHHLLPLASPLRRHNVRRPHPPTNSQPSQRWTRPTRRPNP